MQAVREHLAEPLDELRPAARVAQRERVGAQQQHGAHHGGGQRLTDAGGVAEEQPLLQLASALGRHEGAGQRPEAGGHAVDHLAGGDEAVDDGTGLPDALACSGVQPDLAPAEGHRLDICDRQLRAVEDDGRPAVCHGRAQPLSMGMCTPRSRATSMARS